MGSFQKRNLDKIKNRDKIPGSSLLKTPQWLRDKIQGIPLREEEAAREKNVGIPSEKEPEWLRDKMPR